MFLEVDKYDSLEKEARKYVPNRFLQAFKPVTFADVGYPSRIENKIEVYKFLDSMHEGRFKNYYESEQYNYAPTYEEFEIIKHITKEIYQLSSEKYGIGVLVKAPMLCSMNMLRKIKCLAKLEKKPVIFELGGGAGILGTMLYETGYKYISTDVTQSFYLTQNNLWEGLFPGQVIECIDSTNDLNKINAPKIIHIPYWKLWESRFNDLEVDIMVANHCLTEMHTWSLLFYLQYSRWIMRNSPYKLFIAQMSGAHHSGNIDYLLQCFNTLGYALIYSDQDFLMFCLKDKEGISPIDLKEFLQQCTIDFFYPRFENRKDPTAAAYGDAYQMIQNQDKVSFGEIEEYFFSLNKNINSQDEEFMHYCGFNWI